MKSKSKFQKRTEKLKVGDTIWTIEDSYKVKPKFRTKLKFRNGSILPLLVKTKVTKITDNWVKADKINVSFFLQEDFVFFNESLAKKAYCSWLKPYRSDSLRDLKNAQEELKDIKNELKMVNSLLKQNQKL